jgi:hypothetical protein
MAFYPFENFYIITHLKPAEVHECLEKEVEPNHDYKFFSDDEYTTYFAGYVVNGTFNFKRVIYNRNSFLPQIIGTTESYLNGSRIHVKMRMRMVIIIFMGLWLAGAGLGGLIFIATNAFNNKFEAVSLVPFGMFIFGYLMSTGFFKYESNIAKNKLLELLNGQLEEYTK